jgi:ureidoglycolate dehydrogenase (NAD+)
MATSIQQPLLAGTRLVNAADLQRWGAECLLKVGMSTHDAHQLADSLVQTSLWGVDSHGVARLPHYLERLRRGSIRACPDIRVEVTGPCTAQVHGDQGQGILVAHRANSVAMDLARTNGVGAVGVSDSSHCGAMALYTRAAASSGFVALAFTHADSIAAPYGGHKPFLGTNPISMAFPRAGHSPVCLDMATTSIPWNRVMNARREGVAVPSGVAVDEAGQIATDAQQVRALTPLGGQEYGHKGYGLALVIDLLCGPLNGNPFGSQIPPMFADLDTPRRLGAFLMVIDPMRFAGGPQLAEVVQMMAITLAAQPGAPQMPGDPELAAQANRKEQGIPVEPGLWAEFAQWSSLLGVQKLPDVPAV